MGPDTELPEKDKRGHMLVEVRETSMKCFDLEKEENQIPSFFLLFWEPGF